ncbi:MAG: hypothetical protein LBU97_02530, partial [Alistipes sp.]|nr:hypothetical protein [Alistipes sp.]
MALPKKYNTVIINVLLSVVACLVINFSYLLAIREQERRDMRETEWMQEVESQPSVSGTLRTSKDGYGYIMVPQGDSVYVSSRDIDRYHLADRDALRVVAREARTPGAN